MNTKACNLPTIFSEPGAMDSACEKTRLAMFSANKAGTAKLSPEERASISLSSTMATFCTAVSENATLSIYDEVEKVETVKNNNYKIP